MTTNELEFWSNVAKHAAAEGKPATSIKVFKIIAKEIHKDILIDSINKKKKKIAKLSTQQYVLKNSALLDTNDITAADFIK